MYLGRYSEVRGDVQALVDGDVATGTDARRLHSAFATAGRVGIPFRS